MTATAADLIAALEAEGTPTPDRIAAARAALDAELAAVTAKMHEPIAARPRSADDLATYRFLEDRHAHATFDRDLVEDHRAALADSPGLAAVLRTADVLESVAERAAIVANPLAAASAGAAAVRRYQLAICEQLCEGSTEPSAARDFLETIALEDRIAAVEARAAEHAAAAAAAVEAERRAALRADLDRALAALAAADAVAMETRAAADAAERARHETRCAVLAERLKLSGRDVLRTGHEVFDVPELIRIAPQLGAFDVSRFIAALDRIEGEGTPS